MKKKESNLVGSPEELDTFLSTIDWKELRRKPKEGEKYNRKICSYPWI